ncbi:RHS repeat domain-containing protein [Bacillus thuringiensis]|uniref:RHS repeat-associated core domain-containing protein n=1 Tax=Bacillus thuringiensis TaxID=1428 RepID=A0A9X6TJU3_BACTU|nr:RHS repeat-associated core domain-containing protein [Bacillus thuringiensis]PEA87584.1 hypothetical protein CON71_23770 [Bacillus thuringiensis]
MKKNLNDLPRINKGNKQSELQKKNTLEGIKPIFPKSDTAFESDAFSLGSFTRGSVDPRTGTYNFVLPLAKIKGNKQRGPEVAVNLSYNHFSKGDEGFGIGWSIGLSKFDKEAGKLYLRDGRVIHVEVNTKDEPIIQTVDIVNFIFYPTNDNGYIIEYKDGSRENLRVVENADNQNIYYISSATNEAGYTVKFNYIVSKYPVLHEIIDSDNIKLMTFTPGENIMEVAIFPGLDKLSTNIIFSISGTDRRLIKCHLKNQTKETNSYRFTYTEQQSFTLLSKVTHDGFSEEIFYNQELEFPMNGPYRTIPAVSSYEITMYAPESKEYKQIHVYQFTEANFTGFFQKEKWIPNVIDNIYFRDPSYTYQSTEKIHIDGEHHSDVTRTYNKYHLLIEETISNKREQNINHVYTYYADVKKSYQEQIPQYKFLKKKITTYTEFGKSTSEITKYEYDQWGNILLIDMGEAGKQVYAYGSPYKGFVRDIIQKEEYKGNANNSFRTEYSYKEIRGINNLPYKVIEIIKEGKVKNGEMKVCKEISMNYYDIKQIPLIHGLCEERKISLLGKFISKEVYRYEYNPQDLGKIQITSEKETTDRQFLSTLKEVSIYTGQKLLEVDSTGVRTKYTYDRLGRILSVTTGDNSQNAATTSYTYKLEDDLFVITETSPDNKIKKTYLDGLNNPTLVKYGPNECVMTRKYYNTLQQVLEEHTYDYGVHSSDYQKQITTEVAHKYYYDAWGKLCKIQYSNGIEYIADYNMIEHALTEYLTYEHASSTPAKHISKYNKTGKIVSEEYTSGKGEVLQSISYEYDEFNNVKKETLTVKNSEFRPLVKQYEYDEFDRVISVIECEQGEVREKKTSYTYSPYTDQTLQTAIYVQDKLIGTRRYDGLNRLVEEKTGDSNPKKYTYYPGYFRPNEFTTPRERLIKFKYAKELNYLPTDVEDVKNKKKFSYTYNPGNGLITKQENGITSRALLYDVNYNLTNENITLDEKNYETRDYLTGELGTMNAIYLLNENNPKPKEIKYGYNEKGQLITTKQGDLSTVISYTNDFPKEVTFYHNSNTALKCLYYYDEMGRETLRIYKVKDTELCQVSLIYNEMGKIKGRWIGYDKLSVDYQYNYDIYGRLITETLVESGVKSGNTHTFKNEYEYDDFNNIVSYKVNDNEYRYSYDEYDPCKLLTVTTPSNEEKHIMYDSAGNIVRIGNVNLGAKKFEYDSFEKLASVKKDKEISRYTHDYAGRQYLQEHPTERESTTMLYTPDDKLSTVIKNNLDYQQKIDYSYLHNQLSYVTDTNSSTEVRNNYTQIFNDMTGSTYGWVNASDASKKGNLHLYNAYGYSDPRFNSFPFAIQFAGEYLEKETQLYHLGHGYRAYDPLLMRFLQPDESSPFDGGGINPYVYALGDPINFTDPSGHISTLAAVGIGLGAVGALASVFTFGLGAVAAGGALAFLQTAGGILAATSLTLEVASLSTGIASAILENTDSQTSHQLSVASSVLGIGALITGLGALGKSARPLLGIFKRENIISGAVDSIEYMGVKNRHLHYLYSANYKGGSLLVTHGDPSMNLIASVNGKWRNGLILSHELSELPGYNPSGPLYLMSCGAGRFGRASNAQLIANTLNRPVISFPSKYTWAYSGVKPTSVSDTVTFLGWPNLAKFTTFNPM